MPPARPIVFLGPTMDAAQAALILDAVYLPPAASGSVAEAVLRHRPAAIVLIDGTFGSGAAVRHAEILWAMSRGVPVLGAASMGALRAAELHGNGMIGVGLVFRWYRRFALAPDDAVAVLHAPPEFGCWPLTCALVDLRMTARRAERRRLFGRRTRLRLERAATGLNFRDRTVEAIVVAALADAAPERRDAVRVVLEQQWLSQKRADAVSALRLLARPDALLGWRVPDPPFVATSSFRRDMAEIGLDCSE